MLNDRLIRWFSRPTTNHGMNTLTGMPVTLITDVGSVREENQDRVAAMRVNTVTAASTPFAVVALVDGMGGMRNGSECATRALSAFFNAIIRFRQKLPKDRLELAANIANEAVYEFSRGGGGATLSALLVSGDQDALTLNVGDSRIYSTVLENDKEKVVRLTVDDSLEEAVGGSGKELLQFIGMGDGLSPHVRVVPNNAKRILISSDGIHFVRHESLCDVLLEAQSSEQASEQLLTLARWRGAPDNASLALTSLPELSQALSKIDEAGVEIWDPFSALHVMWLKQEQSELPVKAEHVQVIVPKDLSKEKICSPEHIPVRSKSTKNANKPKVTKAMKKPKKPDSSPQLSIEINPNVNQGKDK